MDWDILLRGNLRLLTTRSLDFTAPLKFNINFMTLLRSERLLSGGSIDRQSIDRLVGGACGASDLCLGLAIAINNRTLAIASIEFGAFNRIYNS
jgi:hypothetical protein